MCSSWAALSSCSFNVSNIKYQFIQQLPSSILKSQKLSWTVNTFTFLLIYNILNPFFLFQFDKNVFWKTQTSLFWSGFLQSPVFLFFNHLCRKLVLSKEEVQKVWNWSFWSNKERKQRVSHQWATWFLTSLNSCCF